MDSDGNYYYSDDLKFTYSALKFNYDLLKTHNLEVEYPATEDRGRNKFKELANIMATAYLKDGIRVDSKLDVCSRSSEYVQRYFYRHLGRYLCENDFGMKRYGGEVALSDITPFAEAVQRKMRNVLSNIQEVKSTVVGDKYSLDYRQEPYFLNLRKELEVEYEMRESLGLDNPNMRERDPINNRIHRDLEQERDRINEKKLSEAFNSPTVKNIIFNGIPFAKFANEIGSRKNKEIENFIDNDLGEEKDLYKKLKYFESSRFREGIKNYIIRDSFVLPELGNKIVATSIAHEKPVIIKSEEDLQVLLNNAGNKYIDKIKRDIVNSDQDESTRKISNLVSSGRGEGSPYSFHPFDLHQVIKKIGVDKFLELQPKIKDTVLEKNEAYHDLNIKEFIDGINGIYEVYGTKISGMKDEQIKKEMWHDKMLKDSGIWEYFFERKTGLERPRRESTNVEDFLKLEDAYQSSSNAFFENLSKSERKKLFFEGKQMYWLAKQIKGKQKELDKNKNIVIQGENVNDEEKKEFKFYNIHSYINWKQYDFANIDTIKLTKYLGTHGNIICSFLVNDDSNHLKSNINLETVMKTIEAIESGVDMKGVALAFDKNKYLEGILSGQEGAGNLEYALKDWPPKLRDLVSIEEFRVYFENADEYLYQDPNGIIRYAELLQKEPEIRKLLSEKVEKKSDLDLRLCLSVQTQEVRNWYFEGVEYVGGPALDKYFMRFQATREQAGGYLNLHDALYWIPNIKRVEREEAKALLDSIVTVDDSNELRNFLPRYNKESDQLKLSSSIGSLRELKKRVFAIESNIDLSTLSPELIDIISAPGFNLAELKRLQGEQRFTDLVDGKLDKEQSFIPYKRTFTSKPLNELLKEGLGSFRDKIRGTAQDPKGLFDSIRKIMQGREVEGKKMEINDLLNEVPFDMEEEVLKLLQNHKTPVGLLFEAKVHAKSDPEGWVCGNYTDCCMPFGDYKNTDYMFNKGTQYFTIKYNDRIIAQSVVTNSVNTENNESVIVLDNIEVANNFKNQAPILSKIYKTFWAEYTSLPVKIGTGYSDLIPEGAKLELNSYSPKYSLSYSDANGTNIYDLPKIKGVEPIDKILTFSNISERDAEVITKMEKDAYPDGMAQGKGEILDIIRKSRELDLPGAASSFILRQGNEPAGYLLVLPEESKINSGESVAHIYDMVVLPKFQGGIASRKMMERMLDTAKAYDLPAIEFEARESTSYRLITNPRIAKWIESKGFKLTYNELLPKYLNGEDFHYIRLEKMQSQE